MTAFLIDEDVATGVAGLLTASGHDAITLKELGRKGSKDDAVLWIASSLQRVLISHNVRDFELLHRAWHRWTVRREHAGILLPRQAVAFRPGQIAQAVLQFLEPGLDVAGELYTFEAAARWRRFDLASELADTLSF